MKIEDSSELIFTTYYMVDWGKVRTVKVQEKCVQCGEQLYSTEVEDREGKKYTGVVCHRCKRVIWLKN